MTLAPRSLPAVRDVELGAAAFVPHLTWTPYTP